MIEQFFLIIGVAAPGPVALPDEVNDAFGRFTLEAEKLAERTRQIEGSPIAWAALVRVMRDGIDRQ